MLETGYLHPGYAAALTEFGSPLYLQHSGGWILEREITGTCYRDAMGCYPLFVCKDWSQLHLDLNDLKTKLVSLALVSDPMCDYDPHFLSEEFDLFQPFKEHFVTDLTYQLDKTVSKHHRYYARKALRTLDVQRCEDPISALDEWTSLYGILTERHCIRGIRAFSRQVFDKLFQVPGLIMFQAMRGNECLAAELWLTHADIAYYHLAASTPAGYEEGALYAVHWQAMQHFQGRLRWIVHGAAAGLTQSDDGLTQFKRGWSTGTRTAYFCGCVLDPIKYALIMHTRMTTHTSYFPAYRTGEFA